MSVSPQTLEQLQQLIANDPDLVQQLRQTQTPSEAAAILNTGAARAGIVTDAAALEAHFDQALPAATTDLTDEQLDAVAGGNDGRISRETMIWMSVVTIGFGCSMYSLAHTDVAGQSCKYT